MADRLPFLLLLLWLVVAPVFLGSVPEAKPAEGTLGAFIGAGGGYALYVLLGAAAAVALLPGVLSRRGAPLCPDRGSRWMVRCLALLPALALFQLLPLPRALHGLLAPAHLADLEVLVPGASWSPVSTDPGLTLRAVVFLALLCFAAVAVLTTCRGARRAWIAAGTLVAVATACAVYGMLESYLFGNRVLSHRKGPDTGVTGTFFLRNNFVAFSVAGLGVAAAGLVAAFRRGRPLLAAGSAMSVAILTAAVFLSRSRAGLGAAALAVLVGFCLSLRTRKLQLAMAAFVIGVFATGIMTLGWVRERVEFFSDSAESAFLDIRVPAWDSTLDLAGRRPVFGCGMGTYRRAIHLTQSPRIDRELWYAHSDPLNLLAEGGGLGLLLGAGLVLLGVAGAIRGSGRRGGDLRGLSAACAGGLAGMLVMALVDFPLQVPATALACTLLLFLPAAARAPTAGSVKARGRAWALVAVVVVAAGILAAREVAEAWGKPRFLTRGEELADAGPRLWQEGRKDEARAALEEASSLQPFDGPTRYQLAEVRFRTEGPGSEACARELRAAYRGARGHKTLLYRIGTLAHRTRERDLAARAFREAGTIDVALFIRAFGYLARYDMDLALAIVPDDGIAHREVGLYYRAKGRKEEAVAAFWRAVDLDAPGRVDQWLADLYRDLGREEEGRQLFAERGVQWPGK